MGEMGAYLTGLLGIIGIVFAVIFFSGLALFVFTGLFLLILTYGPKFIRWFCQKTGMGHLFQP